MLNRHNERYARFDALLNPTGATYVGAVLVIVFALVATMLIIYLTGGVKFVYEHMMYLPILLAAVIFRRWGGVLAGLAAGLILGPLMPLDVAAGEAQPVANWLYRTLLFMGVGWLASWFASRVFEQLRTTRWLLLHDADTTLPNHSALLLDIQHAIASAPDRSFNVVVVGLDNLNDVASTLGYGFSDRIAQQAAERLTARLPGNPTAYRLTADQLGLRVPHGPCKGGDAMLARIALMMQESIEEAGIALFVDTSIGATQYPEDGEVAEVLVRKANVARQNARRRGQPASLYSAAEDASSRAGLALVGSIPEAIATDQFELVFQPQFDLHTYHTASVEALLRWQHPQIGSILPYAFMPQVERTGLMKPLTRWVVARVLYQLRAWLNGGLELPVAINISSRNLLEPDFVSFFIDAVEQAGVPPALIELEITEGLLVNDAAHSVAALNRLREFGAGIALDDFGAGYSSLAYLRDLPINTVKIDQAFVRKLHEDAHSRRVAEAAVGLAKSMNATVVAEGVDSRATMEAVAAMGVDLAQGFYITRALPNRELLNYLHEERQFGSHVLVNGNGRYHMPPDNDQLPAR